MVAFKGCVENFFAVKREGDSGKMPRSKKIQWTQLLPSSGLYGQND